MTLTLLMPWFPIILAVGVGGRLLGRHRGYALGMVSALFWIVLVQATAGVGVWRNAWVMATVLLGAAAICFMGGWAGEMPPAHSARKNSRNDPSADSSPLSPFGLGVLAASLQRFDDWLDEHRDDSDPWPAFGEFVRSVLLECCTATHVKLHRLANAGAELSPLHETEGSESTKPVSARGGILGHVVTTGRAYVQGDPNQGALIEELARNSEAAPAWCFAVSQGSKRIGVVAVGHTDVAPSQHAVLFQAVERLVSTFWCGLSDAARCRQAGLDDPGSGLLNRSAFLQTAGRSVQDSYSLGEPVAVAMIAVEGLRELNDSGRWEVADDIIRGAAEAVRKKIRRDDCLGRFDGSRFIWLLRRVDSELAGLIAKQVMTRLKALCEDPHRWGTQIHVRCGVAGSGITQPSMHDIVCRALAQSRRARLEKLAIACEFAADQTPVGAGA